MEVKSIRSVVKLSNGVQMPILGLGVYKSLGKDALEAIDYALECGYRLIDTASFYHNEQEVGKAVRRSGIPREEIFVTTKVWNDDHGYENTLEAFERSRNELGMDYVDLYLIHWPVPDKFQETWRALERLYKEKKVRAIGVSNFLEHHLQAIIDGGQFSPMVVQNEFHPRLIQQDLLDFCKGRNIQYQAWSPLMRGRILKNELLKRIAEKHNKTVAQVVIRWHLQKEVSPIPKSVHRERIRQNAEVFDFSLGQEDMALINGLDGEERTGAHPDNFMEHFQK